MISRTVFVLVEGPDDQYFVGGALAALGYEKGSGAVARGDHGWILSSGGRTTTVTLRQCEGKDKIQQRLKNLVERESSDHVLVIFDGDVVPPSESRGQFLKNKSHSLRSIVTENTPSGFPMPSLEVALWWCDDAVVPGVPTQQCLERLVCAAVGEVHSKRLAAINTWLASRPDPGDALDNPKCVNWSLMAGWFPEWAGAPFLKAVWTLQGNLYQRALIERLEACQVWPLLASLSSPA